VIFIGLGIFFLLQQQNLIPSNFNWWAFFILVPGALMVAEAVRRSNSGSLDLGRLVVGIILIAVGGIFLLNLQIDILPDVDWGRFWPVILIVIGAVALLRPGQGHRSDSL
jgi:hypothetical protein